MGRIKEISREPAHRRKGNTVQNICFVYRRKTIIRITVEAGDIWNNKPYISCFLI